MTFLSAAQSAAIRLIGKKPTTFFSSTNTFELEICDLANDAASDIMKANDWRLLTTLQVMTGDGVTQGFDLPADYDRMPVKAAVFRPDWNNWHYTPATDLDQWRDFINGAPTISPGYWILLSGQMQFQPPISSGDKAQYYYISNKIVLGDGGAPQAQFTKDSDSLRVDERLLTLALIWKWRAQKRLEYAEDMASYEQLLAQIIGREKGARIYAEGRQTINGNVSVAYPWALGPGL